MSTGSSSPNSRPRRRHPWLTAVLVLFIAACIAATAGMAALSVFPGLAIIPAARQLTFNPYCSLWKTVRDAEVKLRQARLAEEFQRQTTLLEDDGEFRLWRSPHGDWWVPGDSETILPTLLAQQERKIYGDAASGGVRPGDVVIDCGAHIGVYTRYALDQGASLVIAVEPSPLPLEALRRNLAEEIRRGRVIVVEKGVWDEEGFLTFYENGNGGAGDSFVNAAPDAIAVSHIPVTTLDAIVAELGLERVDLVKADIKGAAARMIRGATETIRRWKPRFVISTEEPPEDPQEIAAALHRIEPSYRTRCGPCLVSGDEVRVDVMFFE